MRSILLLAVTLTGCTTTAQVQNAAPSKIFSSNKTAAALEECIAMKLSNLGLPNTVRGEGRTIMAYGQPNPIATITIIEAGADRSVELRTPMTTDRNIVKWMTPCL